jgi:galactokinase
MPAWTKAQGEQRARVHLRHAFEVEADGVWSAPGQLTIIGEHTDYNHGLSLPTITPHRTFVAGRLRNDDRIRIACDIGVFDDTGGQVWEGALDSISAESATGWPGYPTGVLWALQEHGLTGKGVDLALVSCVPWSTGLSNAASVEAAVARAVNDMWRLSLDTDVGLSELAEACTDGENVIARMATGGLGQHAVLRCHDNEAILLDFKKDIPETTACPLYFPDYGLAMLVIDTMARFHVPGGVSGLRKEECMRAAEQLGMASLRDLHSDPAKLGRLTELSDETLRKRARHVFSENDRVMLVKEELSGTGPAHERFVSIGKAISRSHTSLAADFEVSCPELDLAVQAASVAGALGARMIGGGFGGPALALIRRSLADRTAQAITQAFRDQGYQEPQYLLV